MNPSQASMSTKLKVGVFSIAGLLLIGFTTVLVNDKPFWYRPCQLVFINVEDATGLKEKSGVRSLGIEIGYIRTVELFETTVRLGICVTAPVEVLPETRAYLRGDGFLGDKFVELKPVKYIGSRSPLAKEKDKNREPQSLREQEHPRDASKSYPLTSFLNWLIPAAQAETPAKPAGKPVKQATKDEIPVGEGGQDMQQLITKVNDLVGQMTNLTTNLRDSINPEDLKKTMRELNRTLENASKTLSPDGGLTQTAQRSLAKLEDAIEQMRDQMARVNRGEGSLGKLLNDPVYADQVKELLKNANRFLTKVGEIRINVDMGGENVHGYDSARGWFQLNIWPKPERYYKVGISLDPRGRRTETTTDVTAGGVKQSIQTTTVEQSGILVTFMLGRMFFDRRLEAALGILHADGALYSALHLGPKTMEDRLQLRGSMYTRSDIDSFDGRVQLYARPYEIVYVMAGVDSFRRVGGQMAYSYGAGITFDDEDIKILFTFK